MSAHQPDSNTRRGNVKSLGALALALSLGAGATAQELPPAPVPIPRPPTTPAPATPGTPRPGTPASAVPADPAAPVVPSDPDRKPIGTEPRKQPDTEHIAPVKIGAAFETTPNGVRVMSVGPRSVAAAAGLLPGDHVLRIAGSQVLTPYAIDRRFHSYPAGAELEVVVLRNGKEVSLKLALPADHEPTLLEKPREAPTRVTVVQPVVPNAVPLLPATLELGWTLQERDGKVLVTEVAANSLAAAAGVQRGDLVVHLNRQPITTRRSIDSLLALIPQGDVASFEIDRVGRRIPIVITLPTASRAVVAANPRPAVLATPLTLEELTRRQLAQEELLRKVLADLELIRAELNARK